MEHRKVQSHTPESGNFWWNLLANNRVVLPSQEVRQFFVERYTKKQFKIYYETNFVGTKWHKKNCGKCSVEDFKVVTANRKVPTLEHIEVVYKKYTTCRDEFDRVAHSHQLLVMLTEYINMNCYDILHRGY